MNCRDRCHHKKRNKCCRKSKTRVITVGSHCKDDFLSVQKALDKLRTPCVINGPTTIKVYPGVYEVENFDNLFAGSPGDFLITGDERNIAGFAVAHGMRINQISLPDLGSGVASVTLATNTVTITATDLDLTKQELKAGDKIYITGPSSDNTEEYVIDVVNIDSLKLTADISAGLLSDSGVNGLTVTFQPNVKFTSEAVLIETAITLKGITWEGNNNGLFEIRSKVEINNMVISFYTFFAGTDAIISNTGSPVTLLNSIYMIFDNSKVNLEGLSMSGFRFAITSNINSIMNISKGFYSGKNSSEPLFILSDNDDTSVRNFDINLTSAYQFAWAFSETTFTLVDVTVMGGESTADFIFTVDNSIVTIINSNINLTGKCDALYLAVNSSTITLTANTYIYDPANVPGVVYDAKTRSSIVDTDDHSSETAAPVAYKSIEGSFIRAPDNPANRWPGAVVTDIGGQVLP